MEEKINKFEKSLTKEITKLYRDLELAKKEYESHIQNFGFNDCTGRDLARIQIIGAKIEAVEKMLDEFGYIFNREAE